MKKTAIFFLTLLASFHGFPQLENSPQLKNMYKLEDRIMRGDKDALEMLAPYLDSNRTIIEPMGYHRIQKQIRWIARRIFMENFLLTPEEHSLFDSSLANTDTFLRYLHTYGSNFIFDDTTGQFLLTPVSGWRTAFDLRAMSKENLLELDSSLADSPYPDWVYTGWVIKPLAEKDPLALLRVAAALYKTRVRYDRYDSHQQEYLDLMEHLTHEEVGVPDEKGNTTFAYAADYKGTCRLNYLIYWVHHYKDYTWDEQRHFFVNRKGMARQLSVSETLTRQMTWDDSAVAMNAFIRLAEMGIDSVHLASLFTDHSDISAGFNHNIPMFTFNFLNVLNPMIQYCRQHSINYKPAGTLAAQLDSLRNSDLPFTIRYQLEDRLTGQLTLNGVTSVEYFGLLHAEDWESTYSIGRVLDKFYSKNWQRLMEDSAALEWYLKKSFLFDKLGIIGLCNKYLKKFTNCPAAALDRVRTLTALSADADVKRQGQAVLAGYSSPTLVTYNDKKIFDGNADYRITHCRQKLRKAFYHRKNDEDTYPLCKVLSRIRYDQIGQVLSLLDEDSLIRSHSYDFLKNDFGIPVDIKDRSAMDSFRIDYARLTEQQLYEKYLFYQNPNYTFDALHQDYKKVYNILKYDVVDAFVGGGGSRREDGVYLLIRLLELKFHTTLGFPKKYCNSACIYGCDCTDRAKYWMRFLVQKGMVIPDPSDPVSISP